MSWTAASLPWRTASWHARDCVAGERVLDLGTGSIAIRVAALVGDGGYVTGGDYTVTICTQ